MIDGNQLADIVRDEARRISDGSCILTWDMNDTLAMLERLALRFESAEGSRSRELLDSQLELVDKQYYDDSEI